MIQSQMNLQMKPYIRRTVVPLSRLICGEVGVGEGMENPTPVQNFTYLEPDSIISSLFVQSVIFGHSCVVC